MDEIIIIRIIPTDIQMPTYLSTLFIIPALLLFNHPVSGESRPLTGSGHESEFSNAGPDTIRVLNYNIRYGLGMDDLLDLRRIAGIILETEADLVALQEVDVGVERSYRFDLMKILSGYTGLEPVFYKNIPHQGGEYGNGILSRYPVISSRNLHLVLEGDGEQRGLLQAEVVIKGQKLAFMNTHLDHRPDDTQRLASVEQIIEAKRSYRGMPVLISGDFNDTPDSETHEKMRTYFEDAWELMGEGDGFTFPSDDPNRRIDYVFYSNNVASEDSRRLRPVSIEIIDTQASDHLPILAVFVLE